MKSKHLAARLPLLALDLHTDYLASPLCQLHAGLCTRGISNSTRQSAMPISGFICLPYVYDILGNNSCCLNGKWNAFVSDLFSHCFKNLC
ncbi:hypothetical protein FIBSPDRAFT_590360 [Athelia psychrophila]|uniref:Uncharacterized protein n=1 Tax=Athelia psychrophila TaxID=1759441 RepID=A0A166H926_9AGAM|nr:hypothetical protein FIBSPDRAFT_590360 [Fibularhizoctonia sp. CBS 109695]